MARTARPELHRLILKSVSPLWQHRSPSRPEDMPDFIVIALQNLLADFLILP
jgi:hypothetical protein